MEDIRTATFADSEYRNLCQHILLKLILVIIFCGCNTNHSQSIVDLTSAMFTFTENIGYSVVVFIIYRVGNMKDTK
jgi:hypothetical protein